jgi:general nucleoside transport system permease protein
MSEMSEIFIQIVSLLAATIRLATPLVLAALGGLFSERSGVVDIGLEGKMLGAAFAAASAAAMSGSPWLGLAAAIAVAIALALVHGYAAITHHGNQVVSGMALNILVAGLVSTLAIAWFNQGGNTPQLAAGARFGAIELPFAGALAALPVLGTIVRQLVSGHTLPVYLAAIAVPLAAMVLSRTRFGLRLRAVGENPEAVEAAGISVPALRYRALICTGILCGIAGADLALAQSAGFFRGMSAGRGYLALAALIFGKWRPAPTLLACLFFAFADVLQTRLQGVALPGIGVIPVQFIQALPYILTVLLLAGFVGKARPPRAIGLPYMSSR